MVTKKSTRKAPKMKCCSFNLEDKGCGGFAYFLGFIGAAIYYVSSSVGVWGGIVGVLKAAVWPAFLIHAVLTFIGA
jgi:hypothetical protein